VPAGRPKGEPLVFPGDISAVAIAPDGNEIAVGGRDYFISRYDLRNGGRPNRKIRLDEYAVALSYSPDGKTLATGTDRRSARIWSLGAEPASIAHFVVEGKVSSLRWSVDSKRLAVSGSEDHSVYCHNAETFALALEPFPHPSGVRQVAVSDNGSQILTVGADGKVRLWPVSAPIPPPEWLRDYLRAVCGVAFSKEQQLVQVPMSERLALRAKLLATQPPDPVWAEVLRRYLAPPQ
jgi:eukaryotic-like serine/threonine-protein kinase